MILKTQDIIKNFEDKSNFSSKLKKIIKEDEKLKNIVQTIVKEVIEGVTRPRKETIGKDLLSKKITTLIKQNNINISKIDKSSFNFSIPLIYEVLDRLELNKKYLNELQIRNDPNYIVPVKKIKDLINFVDLNTIIDHAKFLNNQVIKINFDKEIEEVSDIFIQNMNITK